MLFRQLNLEDINTFRRRKNTVLKCTSAYKPFEGVMWRILIVQVNLSDPHLLLGRLLDRLTKHVPGYIVD